MAAQTRGDSHLTGGFARHRRDRQEESANPGAKPGIPREFHRPLAPAALHPSLPSTSKPGNLLRESANFMQILPLLRNRPIEAIRPIVGKFSCAKQVFSDDPPRPAGHPAAGGYLLAALRRAIVSRTSIVTCESIRKRLSRDRYNSAARGFAVMIEKIPASWPERSRQTWRSAKRSPSLSRARRSSSAIALSGFMSKSTPPVSRIRP